MEELSRVAVLKALLGRDADLVARLAAPLWARVGRTITVEDLAWTRALGGDGAPKVVWAALEESTCSSTSEMRLSAECVARLCSALLSQVDVPSSREQGESHVPGLVWTLPLTHVANAHRGSSYRDAIIDLVSRS
jgi:hypothetical protein